MVLLIQRTVLSRAKWTKNKSNNNDQSITLGQLKCDEDFNCETMILSSPPSCDFSRSVWLSCSNKKGYSLVIFHFEDVIDDS